MNNLPWLFTIGELIFFILKLNKKEQIVQKKKFSRGSLSFSICDTINFCV